MSFVLTRFIGSITINKQFAQSLVDELQKSQSKDGTILLVANEILLDPSYIFNYNNTADVNFPGRYDLILVADRFDSQGGRIDLTGSKGNDGVGGGHGCTPIHDDPVICGASKPNGGPGGGGKNGDPGVEGKNIKMFLKEVKDIEMISNGGPGGKGGDGGNGGDGEKANVGNIRLGRGGDGGPGGNGGDGGKAGKIEVFFCNKPDGLVISHHLTSRGGARGGTGEGGEHGVGLPPPAVKGQRGDHPGNKGANEKPKVVKLKLSRKLWEKVIIELGIPSG
jgi:hypothetical protein